MDSTNDAGARRKPFHGSPRRRNVAWVGRLVPMMRGAIAGVIATAAMTTFLVGSERTGVMRGQPPRMMIDRFVPGLHDDTADRVALVSHFAYGAAAGSLFAVLPGTRGGSAARGVVYGVLLWAAGYEGWVPLAGVLPPAHRDQRGRAITMLLGHAIFGSVLWRRLSTDR
jgi:hypothetical protein